MKISKKEVILKNRSFIESFVSGLRPNDEDNIFLKRVGSQVDVSPDSTDDDTVDVYFKPNMVFAVSKGADLNEILNLLSTAINSGAGIKALGLDPIGSMQPVQGIAGATVETLHKIMSTSNKQGNIDLHIPSYHSKDKNKVLKLMCTVSGWTVTNDWDIDEQAKIKFNGEIDGVKGNEVERNNQDDRQWAIPIAASTVKNNVKGIANSTFHADWNLSTDGAIFHDTVSLIQINEIKMTFIESQNLTEDN